MNTVLVHTFEEMPAEQMRYSDSSFDIIVARDILHHVDIPRTMNEIARVAKPNALLVINEIYSHSITDKLRYSPFVANRLYPRVQRLIYGSGRPYITEDERKLNERDLVEIARHLHPIKFEAHFNFLVTRIVPDTIEVFAKVDRILLRLLRPIGRYLAGRILLSAHILK